MHPIPAAVNQPWDRAPRASRINHLIILLKVFCIQSNRIGVDIDIRDATKGMLVQQGAAVDISLCVILDFKIPDSPATILGGPFA